MTIHFTAIGACVTSATLCDSIIASEKATFSTPFAKLGIVPEGCSSVHFERIMGQANAKRMLDEGWTPTAQEALEAGLVQEVVPHSELLACAQARGEQYIKEKKVRNLVKDNLVEEYKSVNMKESYALADAFLAAPFLTAQYNFLKSKGKKQQANIFWFLKVSRPLWSLLLKKKWNIVQFYPKSLLCFLNATLDAFDSTLCHGRHWNEQRDSKAGHQDLGRDSKFLPDSPFDVQHQKGHGPKPLADPSPLVLVKDHANIGQGPKEENANAKHAALRHFQIVVAQVVKGKENEDKVEHSVDIDPVSHLGIIFLPVLYLIMIIIRAYPRK